MPDTACRIFDFAALEREQHASGEPYLEFLRVPALSSAIYVLEPGAWDHQTPHEEDEMYYIVAGRASFQAGDVRQPIGAGSVIYVKAHQEHRFTDIEEQLRVLVFFAARP